MRSPVIRQREKRPSAPSTAHLHVPNQWHGQRRSGGSIDLVGGYADYIRHFMSGLASVPAWAPKDQDHLLRSTSVVRSIFYQPHRI
jgi:hypothetical protein